MSWFDEGTRRHRRHKIYILILVIWVISVIWARFKPQPAGLGVLSNSYPVPASSVQLYLDVTGYAKDGTELRQQEIFDAILKMIAEAKRFVVMDFFLLNEYRGNAAGVERDVTSELTEAIVAKRKTQPEVPIIVITDPINTVYGGAVSPELTRIKQAGVTVITTDLTKLRDSNPWYGGPWRMTARWFGNSVGGKWLPNPFQTGSRVSVRSWLALLNFKANHRKVIIADRGGRVASLVTSSNPHSASSANSNVAVEFVDGPWRELLASEQTVAAFSGSPFTIDTSGFVAPTTTATSTVSVQIATEGKIAQAIERELARVGPNDTVYALIFYLSDRRIMSALNDAALRGAFVNIILDPNKDAFGRTKNGLPNRATASELMFHSSRTYIRWYDTHGEQAHSKMLLIRKLDGSAVLISGSANWTKRNLRDLNLETDVILSGPQTADPFVRAFELFDRLWMNRDGVYTAEYAKYADDSFWAVPQERVMERLGMCSW